MDKWLLVSVRRRLLDADLERLRPQMRGNVLEIGGGRRGRRGDFLPPIGDAQKWIFADINPKPTPHMRTNAEALSCKSGSFDVVLCLEVLEYVDNPARALAEMRRVLGPSGILILATPFLHRMDTPTDLWRFTENGLRRLLATADFQVEQFYAQGAALAVAVNILKFVISSQKSNTMHMLVGFFARPFLSLLLGADTRLAERIPVLKTFSTGYLLLCQAK